MKVFAHFDIKKQVNGRELHFADRNEKRNIDEMYRIDRKHGYDDGATDIIVVGEE